MFASQITSEEIETLPYAAFAGKITLVQKPEGVAAAVAHLAQQSVLGYDTETRQSFTRGVHYGVSLLQLSSAEQAFLFRVDKIGIPEPLISLLQNKSILKIGAAITDDIRGLQRIAAFRAQGFVDLQKMTEAYGIQDKALKKMAAIVLGVRISKSQQTSNWALASYTAEQKLYAATDAWICREIYQKLLDSSADISPIVAASFVDMEKPKKTKPKPQSKPKSRSSAARRFSMMRRAQKSASDLKK
ncbi:MAG: 3'-5' exonuclease domain-containing protein 2 [Prevotellaceae bacterium]|jgi:ribonuclease D|nr:3'-5' exonuclease domain-containing protein 2 [Prevotellaceae bacterium]